MANIAQRIPKWSTKRIKLNSSLHKTKGLLRDLRLNTVCESARCPNISDCFSKPTATFMILGDVCSRQCSFCSVEKGTPTPPDASEPKRIAEAVKRLGLRHVVITSVTRDDLTDGGAGHFAEVIKELRKFERADPNRLLKNHFSVTLNEVKGLSSSWKNEILRYAQNDNSVHFRVFQQSVKFQIEILTPDFSGSIDALKKVVAAGPHIFNHNLETVPRLYPLVRPQADYERSLAVLKNVKEIAPAIYTKSGIMVGFGETEQEVIDVMRDLRGVGCDFITIGQYLQPRKENLPVYEYIKPEVFERYKEIAEGLGFLRVASESLVRSSFNAEEMAITKF